MALAPLAVAIAAGAVLVAPGRAQATGERTCGPVTVTAAPTPMPTADAIEVVEPAGPAHASATVDMDDDGNADVIAQPDASTITVTRGDGVLTLTDVPPDPPYPGYPAQHGSQILGDDLDGDGRDELVRTRWSVPGFRQPLRYETFIVRGTAAPATASVDDVALSITGHLSADIDGDGRDDLRRSGTVILGVALPDTWVRADQALAGTDPTKVAGWAASAGAFVDLDLDAVPDPVVLGSGDGTVIPHLSLSTGGEVPLGLSAPPLWVLPRRADVRTFLQASTGTVEVHNACAEPWMADATTALLGRAPTAADYPTFGPDDAPGAAAREERTRTMVRSQTGRGHLVDGSFAWFLDRPADPVGRAWWVRQLRSAARTPERLMVELLGSAERWRTAGSTGAGWVDATFPKLFGRTPDPGGRAYWIRQVDRLGTARTAARMFASAEARRFLVRRVASQPALFGNPVPPGATAEGQNDLATLGFDAMLAGLASSAEHYLVANQRHVMAGT